MHKNINGDRGLIAIERAINELRCGRAVYCREASASADPRVRGALLASAETASPALLSRLEQFADGPGLALAITQQRAETLGLDKLDTRTDRQNGSVLLRLHAPISPATVGLLAGLHAPALHATTTSANDSNASSPGTNDAHANATPVKTQLIDRSRIAQLMGQEFSIEPCDAIATTALNLAKHARLLPAVLVLPAPPPPADEEVLEVSLSQMERLARPTAFDLERVSEARVPLASHEDCRLVLFRDGSDASEHIAVIIGSPDTNAVPVRLHSACLTGDLLGSLRCDCGDQLRGAVSQLAAAGGGVLLYLAQEGRGIGLANKLRAYELQDTGLDTIEADRHLGFRADERSYAAAASMLRQLGMTRIHLLTNNLEKIDALQKAGIEVVAGQRLLGAVNRHNVRYIRAKRERAGHLMPEVKVEGLP
ncbi:MAG TPA: GTP cyclohydrolase II RibA [Steroidobacteraceae bacterium]